MLSLWKLRVGAENYYIGPVARGLEDYYTGHGEMPGRWIGAATSGLGVGLGVGDIVVAEDLEAVLAGLQPGTGLTPNGEQLRTWRNRVPGTSWRALTPPTTSGSWDTTTAAVRPPIGPRRVMRGHASSRSSPIALPALPAPGSGSGWAAACRS